MDTEQGGGRARPFGVAPDGHRLPDGTRIGPVRLQVADLERSLDYYRDILGLRVLERRGPYAALAAEGGEVPGGGRAPLVVLHEREGVSPVPRRGRLGLFHFAILLPDRGALGRLAAHLGRLHEVVGASDHLVSEALYLRDPDGLGVEICADRPRASWRYDGEQIVMATEPLDVDDLVRAGGGEPWAGMPQGTVIGHVHLHVGDLERAEAFYHRALGLDKVVWSYPGALFLSVGGYHHHLGVNTWATGAVPAGEGDARLLEWELRVPSGDDVARAAASLRDAGHAVERGPDGALARDPWGTALRIREA